ncbi:XdhC family protein [Nocardioides sp. Kera G14]|uniref:XdhC family protein n=1 Tax=Nocardioides sp. Kera G14 TaxID=2884264 RepID=UPI001D115A88|nr:XdhC family protein [Nocardioides sp. Kera G14]UDY23331.1 XdhC family protein [Nocardioides sp. Kera G14]
MREVSEALARWNADRTAYALARVVETWSSAPRLPGAAMAVSADGEVVGSLSGGCVEGAVIELAQQVLVTGEAVLETYGVTDSDAFAVGLTCGGVISVLVEPVTDDHVLRDPAVLATLAEGRDLTLRTTLADGLITTTAAQQVGEPTGTTDGVFVHAVPAPPLMVLTGANDFVRAVAGQGRALGHRVVVVDPRPALATPERFPDADAVVVDWPHRYLEQIELDERSVICVLSHDPKFDVPALQVALASRAGYVGAMGSRRTDRERREALASAGVSAQDLERLSSPIGLDLAAATPQETAVAIAAEIVMLARGGTPQRLITTTEAIHR